MSNQDLKPMDLSLLERVIMPLVDEDKRPLT